MDKSLINIIFRYVAIFLLGLGNLYIFYLIFTPLTVYPIKWILGIFGNISTIGKTFIFNGFEFTIIDACVAGAAYYLLFILIMSCFNIDVKKRICMILTGVSGLLFLNVFRIVLLVLINNSVYFNIIHKVFWYVLSILFVVGIWFLLCKVYHVNTFPFISDFSYIYNKYCKQIKKSIKNKKA